jgi:hypothetical protein
MLQFDAGPVVTSNPSYVNCKEFLSRDRECSAICATGAARGGA